LFSVRFPAEVYTKPANTFVAGFIGSPAMHFLESRDRWSKFDRSNNGFAIATPDRLRGALSAYPKAKVVLACGGSFASGSAEYGFARRPLLSSDVLHTSG